MRENMSVRITTILVVVSGLALFAIGCEGGHEGDRCNPLLSHDECGSGLSCQQPPKCAESYCCPANASSSTHPFCNGASCSQVDAAPSEQPAGDAAVPADAAEDG